MWSRWWWVRILGIKQLTKERRKQNVVYTPNYCRKRSDNQRGTISPVISITILEDTFMMTGGGYLLPFSSIATNTAWRIRSGVNMGFCNRAPFYSDTQQRNLSLKNSGQSATSSHVSDCNIPTKTWAVPSWDTSNPYSWETEIWQHSSRLYNQISLLSFSQ